MQGPKGSKQVHRHRKLQSSPSDSGLCGDGVANEDSKSFQLGWRSSKQQFGTPMKKLLAEELSRETESKRRAPGVIGRLMGLDGLPLQLPANKHHNAVSENNLRGTTQAVKTRRSGTSRRSPKHQQEFKDVFEVSEIPKEERCRYSLRGSVELKITDAEMSFVEQKFMEARCRATYQDLQSSQDSHDTLENLDSNNNLLQKYFKRPDSLFERHLDDLQAAPSQSHFGHIEGMKSSDIETCERVDIGQKSDREMKGLNYNRSHQKHLDGCSCHFARRHAIHSSAKSSKIQFKGRDEPDPIPTRIVVLKPNLEKVQNATKIGSSPCSSYNLLSECGKHAKFSDIRFRNTERNQRKNLPDNAWHSRQNSLESREIAKEITSQMKNSLNSGFMIFSSSRFRGYTWDDSSCSFSGNESPKESEVTSATLGKSFDMSNTISSSPCFSESSVSREAKKRLSERWKKMSLKSQQGHLISRSGTLAEMLAIPEKEMKAANFDSISCGEGVHDKVASNGKPAGLVEPLGISSRDGWKDGCIGSLTRSKSLPASSTTFRSSRTILRHEALRDDRFMMPTESCKRERKKVVKCLDQRQCMNTRSSKSGHKKSSCSHSSNIVGGESSPDLNTIQNKMKINLEEDLPKQEVLATESLAEILRDTSAVTEDVMDVANEDAAGSFESSIKESSVGSSSTDSVPFQPPVSGLESSCCKDADQPSPVSVLEPSFTDDLSSCSDCFESLSVDIQGLRMQLQLLKLESEECVEGPMLIQSDEDGGEASTGISEDNGLCKTGDSWEYSYMIDVLFESGIDRAQPDAFSEVWHSRECPVSLSVFDELEKRYSDWTSCPKAERRLLFDRINSGIINIYEQFISAQSWVSPTIAKNLFSKLIENGLQDCLYKMLGSQGKVKDTALGKVLVSELHWLNLRDDIDGIGREVESLLLDDLVAEIAVS